MKVLVVGSGGREHTLVWKLTQDSCDPEIFCAPGNAGTADMATNVDISAEDIDELLAWATENGPDLVIVGPEAPLCLGMVDVFNSEGFRVFGPCEAAARLEGSKAFAKEVMTAAGVPTAKCGTFQDRAKALSYIKSVGAPLVVKADGLAAGKGVIICETEKEAEAAVDLCMTARGFGDAGNTVLVEELLIGEEASILALVDGEHVVMLASSQDHKRALDNDEGLNTGGMGAYSPAPVVTEELWPVIREHVFGRTLRELKNRDVVFKGVLYAGIMVCKDGPKVLEFNVRFGDPETQAVLMRMESDLVPAMEACIDGTLREDMVHWHSEAAVCVVMASGGYPGKYEKGVVIGGLEKANEIEGVTVFHAGTALEGRKVVTSGGRVLGVTALGTTVEEAIRKSYEAVGAIDFEGAHWRTDIAARACR